MTDFSRERLRARWRRPRQEGTQATPTPPPQPSPAVVEIRLPRDSSDDRCQALEAVVGQILEHRTQQLGIDRELEVRVGLIAELESSVEISVHGRLLALCDLPERVGARHLEVVERRIDELLSRRLALLLDEADLVWHASQWESACRDVRAELYRDLPAYLLGNGVRLGVPAGFRCPREVAGCRTSEDLAEVLIDAVAPRVLELRVDEYTLRRGDPEIQGFDSVRSAILDECGVQLPDLSLRPVPDRAAPRVMLNHLDHAGDAGVDTWPLVLGWLQAAFTDHAAWFVRLSDVSVGWEQLRDMTPDLATVSGSAFSLARLTACLRCLTGNRDSVRNLARIMWLLLDLDDGARAGGFRIADLGGARTGQVHRDAEHLASHVRKRMNDEAWQAGRPERPVDTIAIPWELEQALSGSGTARAEAEWELVRAIHRIGPPAEVAVAARSSLGATRHALGALTATPRVVASEELSPDVALPRLPVPAG